MADFAQCYQIIAGLFAMAEFGVIIRPVMGFLGRPLAAKLALPRGATKSLLARGNIIGSAVKGNHWLIILP